MVDIKLAIGRREIPLFHVQKHELSDDKRSRNA